MYSSNSEAFASELLEYIEDIYVFSVFHIQPPPPYKVPSPTYFCPSFMEEVVRSFWIWVWIPAPIARFVKVPPTACDQNVTRTVGSKSNLEK